MLASERPAGNAAAARSGGLRATGFSPTTSAADLTRYRPVEWALTIGPATLVIALSGTALVATTDWGAGIRFLGTGFTGFRDLARVRRVAQRARAEEIVVLASVGAPA
jgi:hypothetical protein